jgi:3-oxoacyl-[acyl-carrier-protein] synthase-3
MTVPRVGIVGCGQFLPEHRMTAAEIADASGLPEWVVREKLGIESKAVAPPDMHPNQMGVWAAQDCLDRTGVDPKEIDVVLCTTEEWKEYSLWTAGIDLAYEIGATNAWAMDMHMRCATTVAALKTARSIMAEDADVDTILIGGGYRVSDFIDFTDRDTSFLFNIGSGGAAMILRRDHDRNEVLGAHLMADGSMSRHVLVPAGGTVEHPTPEAIDRGDFFFRLLEPEAMKSRLNDVSIDNWMHCVDEALRKSGPGSDGSPLGREDVDFFNMVLVKPSAHRDLLERIGLTEEQSVYRADQGHIGEQDAILNIIEAERLGRLHDGDLMVIVSAGIGYVWAAGAVRWGPVEA